jgi:hypothetical protein
VYFYDILQLKMKKASIIINLIVFQFLFISCNAPTQRDCIFFSKPYTDSYETNLYQKTPLKFDFKTQYNNIKRADVKSEVINANNHHDYRFVAIAGNSYLYPGLEETTTLLSAKYQKYISKYKFKVIAGTSDAINPNLPPLQNVAYHYAQAYNKMLLIKIEELENKKL